MSYFEEIIGKEHDAKIEAHLKEKGLSLVVDNPKEPIYVPRERLNEVIAQKNSLKTQVGEYSGQIEEMKKAAKGNDKIQEKIEELQAKNSEWEKKYHESIKKNAVEFHALKEKAKDPADLLKYIELDKLQISDDGTVKGLEEQVKSLKEKKSYLFGDLEPSIPSSNGANPPNLPNHGDKLTKLQEEFKKAEESRNVPLQMAIQSEIMKLSNKGG
jgi:hypothetical protein